MDNRMYIYDENNNEIEMEILFTFNNEEYGKDYVLYFDPTDTSDEVFVSSYDAEGNLYGIEDENEWNMIEEVYGAFIEDEAKNSN